MSAQYGGFMRYAELPGRASGAAILLALLSLSLVAALASLVLRDFDRAIQAADVHHDQAQSRLLASSAIDWARHGLAEDAASSQIDHYGEFWAQDSAAFDLQESAVSSNVEDLSGRFDLNTLVTVQGIAPEQVAAYGRLLAELGVPAGAAEALASTLANHLRQRLEAAAPSATGLAASPGPASPAKALVPPLLDIRELSQIAGYSTELLNRLQPFVVALPVAAPLNVNTASPEVLAAVLPGLGLVDARRLTAERRGAPFKDVGNFMTRLARTDLKPSSVSLAVSSRYFMATGNARYGRASTQRSVFLDRKNPWPEVIWEKVS